MTTRPRPAKSALPAPVLLEEMRGLIAAAGARAAAAVNTELVRLHHALGARLRQVMGSERAEYGQQFLQTVADRLTAEFGKGFSVKTLRHMIRFSEVFPDEAIVSSLMRQLTWTHFLHFLYLPDPLEHEFYAEMCRLERWSVSMAKVLKITRVAP